MKYLLCVLAMLLLPSTTFASCYGCDCNPAGTVDPWDRPTFSGVPEGELKLSLCCSEQSEPIPATTVLSMLGLNITASDEDHYQQDYWNLVHEDIWKCRCDLTSMPLQVVNDPLDPIVWSGEIDPCTSGVQTITGYVQNTTVSLQQVGGYRCVEKDEEHGWCAHDELCTQTVPISVMENNTITLDINVESKDACGSGCGTCDSTAKVCTVCDGTCSNEEGLCVPVEPCFNGDVKTCKYFNYTYTCNSSDPTCCKEATVPVTIWGECVKSGTFGWCRCGELGDEGKIEADLEFCSSLPEPVEECNY